MPSQEQGVTPEVIAWRVSQLEKTTSEGFKALNATIKEATSTFATNAKVDELVANATEGHERIEEKIDTVDRHLRGEISALKRKSWVQNTLSAICGAVLTLLVAYLINDIVK